MSEQTVPPEDPELADFVDATSGIVLKFVNCARCQKELMGENTREAIKKNGDISLLNKYYGVAARVGGRPFCTRCLPLAATPLVPKKRGRPRKSLEAT